MRVASALLTTAVAAAVAAATCGGPRPFACDSDVQCRGESGRCELSGWCSVPDATCPSGRRYEDLAGDDLSGTCTEGPPTGSGTVDTGDDTGTGEDTDSTATSTDTTTTDTTPPTTDSGGPTDDAYGMCTTNSSCELPGSRCLESTDSDANMFRMCAPPCTTPDVPSAECPASVDGSEVGCLGTGKEGELACFIPCTGDEGCPTGMACALGAVCSWPV